MPRTTYSGAIDRALAAAMVDDERIVVFGEDVETVRRDLAVRFGSSRVRNTPVSESAILGTALGAAMAGLRPVADILLVDFLPAAMDMLVNHIAKLDTFSNGTWPAPLVIRSGCGGGYGDGGQHEQALWGMLAGVPGLAVVVPSTPADAAGLTMSALAHPGPVVLLEHTLLSGDVLASLAGTGRPGLQLDVPADGAIGEVADPPEPVPLGVAALRRAGRDVVIVSVGVGVHRSLAAADRLAEQGIDAAVLDLRSVAPLDRDAVLGAAATTGRVLAVDEDYIRGGLSAEIAALIAENGVIARFGRVTCEQTIPYARLLETRTLPNVERIVAAARMLVEPDRATIG